MGGILEEDEGSVMVENIRELKKRLSSRLLQIPGVSGVGAAGGKLTIYLEQDLPGVRRKVLDLVADQADCSDLQFVVTGLFRAAASSH